MPKITPNLWFDTEAEEAAGFYISVFKNSRIVSTQTLRAPPAAHAHAIEIQLARSSS